jgi:type IV pilus biogenesis protein CpaD/CtpE
MRALVLVLLGATTLAACGDPTTDQAKIDTRFDAVRADTVVAVKFTPGVGQLDGGQVGQLQALVQAGKHADRDEFVVVTDGTGGPLQQSRAQQVKQGLSAAGARWVGLSVEPSMAMGPDTVVVTRQEYKIGQRNCPDGTSGAMWNPNETAAASYGCADAYNMGQMLARPRDAAVGRSPGPADATVGASAIERYRAGKPQGGSTSGGSANSLVISSGGGSGGSSLGGSTP